MIGLSQKSINELLDNSTSIIKTDFRASNEGRMLVAEAGL